MKIVYSLLVIIVIILNSCSGTNDPNDVDKREIYKYHETLEHRVYAFIERGKDLPQKSWDENIWSWIYQHDSLKYANIEFTENFLYTNLNDSQIPYNYIMRGDTIVFPEDTADHKNEVTVGIKKGDSIELHYYSIYSKIPGRQTRTVILNNISSQAFLLHAEQYLKSLGPRDTVVYVKSIFQYRKI